MNIKLFLINNTYNPFYLLKMNYLDISIYSNPLLHKKQMHL